VGDAETVPCAVTSIVGGGEVVGKPGVGQFIRRTKFGEQLAVAGP